MKEYKPILVLYFKQDFTQEEFLKVCKEIEKVRERTGYEVISFQGCDANKVEIISVDKATVVEDIQKYIDTKEFDKKKMIDNIESVINME